MEFFKSKKFIRFSILTFIIILLAEIFVFNYKSFLINPFNSSEYQENYLSMDNVMTKGLTKTAANNLYTFTEDNPTITFTLDQPVKTMFFNAEKIKEDGNELEVKIDYATISRTSPISSDKSFLITESVPQSNYVSCSYFGAVKQIKLTIIGKTGSTLIIHGLGVNYDIPMNFSILRVIGLFLLCLIVLTIFKHPAFKSPYNLKRRSHLYPTIAVFVFFIFLTFFVYNIYTGEYDWFNHTAGNQMTQELVDAFENGQVSLVDEVPEELLALDNPYDWSERTDAGLQYKWDHLLFEGKYYSYYGIAPVLTLFLPYHMITGHYFASSLACLLYTLFAVVFLGLCFITIVKKWFSKTPLGIVILGLITTIFSSCALINLLSTQFYEIAQSSALCFLVIGFFFMLNSGIFTKDRIKLKFLLLSSLFVSLAVLSRATCALYAIVMVFWIIYGFFQYKKENPDKVSSIKYIAASITPYIIFAAIQMIYNFLRFGNPLDFGIQYTLTIYDYSNIDLHFSMIMISIVNFLFAVPIINSQFPFIHGNYDSLGVNGYYFVATKPTLGILPITPAILSLLYAPKLAGKFNIKEKIRLCLIWFLPGIVFPIILAAMTWQYGYAMRYNADFGWQLCIAAFVVIMFVYNKLKNKTIKKWLFTLLFIVTVWSVTAYLAGLFANSPMNAVADNIQGSHIYLKIKHLIQFWI